MSCSDKGNTIALEEALIKVRVNGPSVRKISGPAQKPAPRVPAVNDAFDAKVGQAQMRMDTALARPKRRVQKGAVQNGPQPDGPSTAEVNKELARALREQMGKPVPARGAKQASVDPNPPREVQQYQQAMTALERQKTTDNQPRRLQRTGVAAADRAVELAVRQLIGGPGAPAGQRDYNAVLDRAMTLFTEETRSSMLKGGMSADQVDGLLKR